jgi:hypothetical protein
MKMLLAIALAVALPAMGGPGEVRNGISFQLEPRSDSQMPAYIISLDDQGAGRYIEFAPPVAAQDGPAERPSQPITVEAATLHILRSARSAVAPDRCQSHRKGIASIGKMTLSFYENDETVQCVFEYSDEESLTAAVAAFESIAETMQCGSRLQHELRYDRLGLDAEIDSLIAENKDGRAIEIQNIAPVLKSIVDDDRVMERVRRKAARLLQDAAPTPAPNRL